MSEPLTRFKLARVERHELERPLALVTIDNGADHTRPTFFGRDALDSLERVLDELDRGEWAAAVITGKPYFFSAGADVKEFVGASAELGREGSRRGHELFARLRALPFPALAAINGVCLGGGVELALHCHARTISRAVRHFACPECFLGIIPGWGGTQLVPRLVGAETAVRFIVANPMRQNRMLDGRTAHELGFADRLLEPVEFLDDSLAFAVELSRSWDETAPKPNARDSPDPNARDRPDPLRDLSRSWNEAAPKPNARDSPEPLLAEARRDLDDTTHGAAPAPYRALELIEGALSGWSLEDGYAAEEEAIAELLPGPQAQASLYAFDLVERRAKRRPELTAEARPVRRVGIVGAGLMATQLATLFLRRLELPLVVRDVDEAALERARGAIEAELAGLVAKGRYDEGKARFLASLVTTTTDAAAFADCDLILEAVFEELAVKRQVFAELEAAARPDAVFATNTSALSVTELAADLAHPERAVGMHFFNPVALLPLVEIVRGTATDDAVAATAWGVAERLRKRPLVVADAPGFIVNRILTRLLTVVLGAVEHGMAVEEADAAILRLGLPMAPSVLLQMVGPKVALHVLETLHAAYPERFPLSPTLANYAAGRDEIERTADRQVTQEELLDRALQAIADEIDHLLSEGVVADAKDVDTALILGAGFPFWLGGITKYLERTGIGANAPAG